ncbi:MAG TPA: outer membrane protein assembly factor BamD [Sphingomicrobium sp.]|jgi:outer membrane protein assembly factor BamD
MLKFSRAAAVLVACAGALSLTACATGRNRSDTAYVARDVSSLYTAAQRTMERGDYKKAAQLFEEVERQHPYSVWARRAQVMGAFNYYLGDQYNDAISAAQRFLTIHPGSDEAPYAQYLMAMSYYKQINDVTRDQTSAEQASAAFGELIRRYPNTRYATDARAKLDLINDHLAGREMQIGRYYQRAGEWLASTYRFRTVVDQYQTTSHTPEALERLVESYLSLGIPGEARKAAAVLGRNYPDTYWYKQSLRLLKQEEQKTGGRAFANNGEPVGSPVTAPAAAPAPAKGKSRTRAKP